MPKIFFDLQTQLLPVLRAGDLAQCEDTVVTCLAGMPRSPFHLALDLSFTNPPTAVAAYFEDFFAREMKRFDVAAAYAEMNGFDINPDRWFFNIFAFDTYGGHDDYDWLADWQSEPYPEMRLTGLESLQQVYAGPAFRNQQFTDAAYVAGLLVVIKFQDLIRKAAAHMKQLRFPLLATAHEYDFIFEVRGAQ